MAKTDSADVAKVKAAIAEMKQKATTELGEVVRRLQAGDPTAEIVAAVQVAMTNINDAEILPEATHTRDEE